MRRGTYLDIECLLAGRSRDGTSESGQEQKSDWKNGLKKRIGTEHKTYTTTVNVATVHRSAARGSSKKNRTDQHQYRVQSPMLVSSIDRKTHLLNLAIAVSASSTVANCTTPTPFDRPCSKRISASSTLPVVWNSSTRSSFEVDQGSCSGEQANVRTHRRQSKMRIANCELRMNKHAQLRLTFLTKICWFGSAGARGCWKAPGAVGYPPP